MYFKAIWLNNFRCFNNVTLEPVPGLNALLGPNASGKTSLLEAIWMLTRVQSFLTPRIRDVIQHDKESLEISARIVTRRQGEVHSGLEKGCNYTRIRYNGIDIRTASEQALRFPVHVLTPDSHRLISGTPRERRRWLDWGTFHVEQSFLSAWSDYCLAMRQRNTLLRSRSRDSEFAGWEQGMQHKGEEVNRWRNAYLKQINARLPQAAEVIGLHIPFQLSLNPGWDQSQSLSEVLRKMREKDRELGYTGRGPHRADVVFETVGGKPVSRSFSRGQQKQLLLAVALARCQEGSDAEETVLLIDDLPAELDREHLRRALAAFATVGAQVFISVTDCVDFTGIPDPVVFHVEQGRIYRQ